MPENSDKLEVLLHKIRAAFPDITWSEYRFIDTGWDHEVVILDQKTVFRFPIEPDYPEQFADEIAIISYLQPLIDAQLPRYTHITPNTTFAGCAMIQGEPLNNKTFKTLSDAQKRTLSRILANFLTQIHTVNDQSDSKIAESLSRLPKDALQHAQAEIKTVAHTHLKAVLNHIDYMMVKRILHDIDVLTAAIKNKTLIHGDLYAANMLWHDSDNQLGIIDFTDMNIGDPAYDFAELFEYGETFVQEVYKNYQGPRDESLLHRAQLYRKWIAVYAMADHFMTHKHSFERSRQLFDTIKNQT